MGEMRESVDEISKQTLQSIKESKLAMQQATKAVEESKEGVIWILRRDILNSIDLYTSERAITTKQWKRLKDQYNYYHSIGGNHDVESKFDDFNVMIFGTREIKVIGEQGEMMQ